MEKVPEINALAASSQYCWQTRNSRSHRICWGAHLPVGTYPAWLAL